MGTALKTVRPLPGYRLELGFQNGSSAVINMERRVRTLRFAQLASEAVFATARAEEDKVVWTDGPTSFSVYCGELLDTLLLE